jgi:hypothetical protein
MRDKRKEQDKFVFYDWRDMIEAPPKTRFWFKLKDVLGLCDPLYEGLDIFPSSNSMGKSVFRELRVLPLYQWWL